MGSDWPTVVSGCSAPHLKRLRLTLPLTSPLLKDCFGNVAERETLILTQVSYKESASDIGKLEDDRVHTLGEATFANVS